MAPYITTPCFPSYPSNHASGSSGAGEILRRLYGAGGHAITMANAAVPGVALDYTTFKQITDDVDDARVYGGIHFRFDQEAGGRLGREIATYIYMNNLRQSDREPMIEVTCSPGQAEHEGTVCILHNRRCHSNLTSSSFVILARSAICCGSPTMAPCA